jgi:hypothetical protein
VRMRVAALGLCVRARRAHMRLEFAGKMMALGMGPRIRKLSMLTSRSVRAFCLGLGPRAIHRRDAAKRATVLMALALGPYSIHKHEKDTEQSRIKAIKHARKLALKLRSKAKNKTKAVNWDALDSSLNTMWDHHLRPVFSPKDTLRLLLGLPSSSHTQEAKSQRAAIKGGAAAISAKMQRDDDGASTTISSLVARAHRALEEDAPVDEQEAKIAEELSAKSKLLLAASEHSSSEGVTGKGVTMLSVVKSGEAEATDLVTHPAQWRIRELIFGDDLQEQFSMGAKASSAKPAMGATTTIKSSLSHKDAQKVGIALRTLGVPLAPPADSLKRIWELARAVAVGDEDRAGGKDSVTTMRKLDCFGADTIGPVLNDPRGLEDLPPTDLFVRVMAETVPAAQERLDLLTVEDGTVDQLASAEAVASTLLAACQEALSSGVLVSVLRDLVLPVGNVLNKFSKNAAAVGFRVGGLKTMGATKTADGRTLVGYIADRLVQYIVRIRRQALERLPDGAKRSAITGFDEDPDDPARGAVQLLRAIQDLPNASSASKLSIPAAEGDLNIVDRALSKARGALARVQSAADKATSIAEPFPGAGSVDSRAEVEHFLRVVSDRVGRLEARAAEARLTLRRALQEFERTIVYFGEPPDAPSDDSKGGDDEGNVREPGGFFGVLVEFLEALSAAGDKSLDEARKAELKEMAEARLASRKAAQGDAPEGASKSFRMRSGEASDPSALVGELSGVLRLRKPQHSPDTAPVETPSLLSAATPLEEQTPSSLPSDRNPARMSINRQLAPPPPPRRKSVMPPPRPES